jgi:hypothetical protein
LIPLFSSTDVGLAEELERAVAGASVEARLHALKKLRARVKEQAEPDAADWNLSQSTQVSVAALLLLDNVCR